MPVATSMAPPEPDKPPLPPTATLMEWLSCCSLELLLPAPAVPPPPPIDCIASAGESSPVVWTFSQLPPPEVRMLPPLPATPPVPPNEAPTVMVPWAWSEPSPPCPPPPPIDCSSTP